MRSWCDTILTICALLLGSSVYTSAIARTTCGGPPANFSSTNQYGHSYSYTDIVVHQAIETHNRHLLIGRKFKKGPLAIVSADKHITSWVPGNRLESTYWTMRFVKKGAKDHGVHKNTDYEIAIYFDGKHASSRDKSKYVLCAGVRNQLVLQSVPLGSGPSQKWECRWRIMDRNLSDKPHLWNNKTQGEWPLGRLRKWELWKGEGFALYNLKAKRYLSAANQGGGPVTLSGKKIGLNETFFLSNFYKMGWEKPVGQNPKKLIPLPMAHCAERPKCCPSSNYGSNPSFNSCCGSPSCCLKRFDAKPGFRYWRRRLPVHGKRLKNRFSKLCLTGPLNKNGKRPLQQHPCTKKWYSKWSIDPLRGTLTTSHRLGIDKFKGGKVRVKKLPNSGVDYSPREHAVIFTEKGEIRAYPQEHLCLDLKRKSKLIGINFVWRDCNDSKTQKFDLF